MQASRSSCPPPATDAGLALLRHFPAEVGAAYRRLRENGDPAAIDLVVRAVVRDHIPNPAKRAEDFGGATPLVDGLGFDSVAISELVFFFEDLFQVAISNEDVLRVRTVDDLSAFVRSKLASAKAA